MKIRLHKDIVHIYYSIVEKDLQVRGNSKLAKRMLYLKIGKTYL